MGNIKLKNYDLDEEIIAKSIYGDKKREWTSSGIEIKGEIKKEFSKFLKEYNEFVGQGKTSFYRIDAYFDNDSLYILDINASFVYGWGNALNISRAISSEVDSILLSEFPEKFYLQEEIYRPEFELLINELQIRGLEASETKQINEKIKTYLYGISPRKNNLYHYDGIRIDNKINLAMFSKIWEGEYIKIPEIILPNQMPWENIPKDMVFKITGKSEIIDNKRDEKVKIGKPRKGKSASKRWEDYKLLAQEPIKPYNNTSGENMQAILMSINNSFVTGYVQNSVRDIINDNSTQGPLVFK